MPICVKRDLMPFVFGSGSPVPDKLLINGGAESGMEGWEINPSRPYISAVSSYSTVTPSEGELFFHWSRNTSNLDNVYIQQTVSSDRILGLYGSSLPDMVSEGAKDIQVSLDFLCHSSSPYGVTIAIYQYDTDLVLLNTQSQNFINSAVGVHLRVLNAPVLAGTTHFKVRVTGINTQGYLWFGVDNIQAQIVDGGA